MQMILVDDIMFFLKDAFIIQDKQLYFASA
jgi:hypothetical protein